MNGMERIFRLLDLSAVARSRARYDVARGFTL